MTPLETPFHLPNDGLYWSPKGDIRVTVREQKTLSDATTSPGLLNVRVRSQDEAAVSILIEESRRDSAL